MYLWTFWSKWLMEYGSGAPSGGRKRPGVSGLKPPQPVSATELSTTAMTAPPRATFVHNDITKAALEKYKVQSAPTPQAAPANTPKVSRLRFVSFLTCVVRRIDETTNDTEAEAYDFVSFRRGCSRSKESKVNRTRSNNSHSRNTLYYHDNTRTDDLV